MSLPSATAASLLAENRSTQLLYAACGIPNPSQWSLAALRANSRLRYWRMVVRNGAERHKGRYTAPGHTPWLFPSERPVEPG